MYVNMHLDFTSVTNKHMMVFIEIYSLFQYKKQGIELLIIKTKQSHELSFRDVILYMI